MPTPGEDGTGDIWSLQDVPEGTVLAVSEVQAALDCLG